MFCLKEGIVRPTSERITKLLLGIENILKMQSQVTARDFLHLLGIMASCIELIPNARLFMRPIQLHLLFHWKPSSQILEIKIAFSKHLKSLLKWGLKQENLNKGRSITSWNTSITLTTDASKSGYGGHLSKKETFQGIWSRKESLLHINVLEMEAVMLSIQHFLPKLVGKNVLIRLDNSTVVRYINKQGGTHSPQLCMRTWKLWQLALDNQMLLKAAHIAGKKNILADRLSRFKVQPTEWTLNKKIVLKLFTIWEVPHIDLFASHQTDLLLMESRPSSLCNRCSNNSMEPHVGLCISSNMSHSQDSATHDTIQLSTDSYCPTLAKETLVPQSPKINSRLSEKASSQRRSSTSAKIKYSSSKSSSIKSNYMALIDKHFKEKGFSKHTRKLLQASWRKGAQKDYSLQISKIQ